MLDSCPVRFGEFEPARVLGGRSSDLTNCPAIFPSGTRPMRWAERWRTKPRTLAKSENASFTWTVVSGWGATGRIHWWPVLSWEFWIQKPRQMPIRSTWSQLLFEITGSILLGNCGGVEPENRRLPPAKSQIFAKDNLLGITRASRAGWNRIGRFGAKRRLRPEPAAQSSDFVGYRRRSIK